MPTEQQLADYADLLKQFAESVCEAVEATFPSWKNAYIDIRSAPDGSHRRTKLRAVLPDEKLMSVQTTDTMDKLEYLIFQVSPDVFSPMWYGMKLELSQDGDCNVNYDYDPKCYEDETFYDD